MKTIIVILDADGDALTHTNGSVVAFTSRTAAARHAATFATDYTVATLPADGGFWELRPDLGLAPTATLAR